MLEIMIAQHHLPSAGFQAQVEAPDRSRLRRQLARRAKALRGQAPKHRLVIAEHQQMIVRAVAKVVMNALLLTQPLDKVQIGFRVLHAERAWRVDHRAEFEGIGVG